VNPRSLRERAQVARIRSEDVIAIGGQADHRCVNGVKMVDPGQQNPGSSPEPVVNRRDFDPGQQAGYGDLPPMTTAPDLGNYPAVGHRRPSREAFSLDQGDDVTVAALDGNECSCIQYQHQAAPRLCRPSG